ncbi:hypothetical protein BB543_01335 [Escherichia coli]|nr:hypothetical protein BB543_01335 [Escherichia coli]
MASGYVSPAANLPLQPMVGKDLCVSIELDGGGKRYISGLVTAARVPCLKLFLIAPSISSSHRAMKGQLPV